jgi:hypothetical protein
VTDDLRERAAAVLASNPDAGRRTLVKALGVSDRQAINLLRALKPHTPAQIEPEPAPPPSDDPWAWAIAAQERRSRRGADAAARHVVTLPAEPVAVAFLSDLHTGSAGTDYRAMRADAETVRDTPGMYAVFHGDGTDNWIVGKLTGLQRGQALDGDDEWEVFAAWVAMVAPKLLCVVSGNHDLWTLKMAGVDRLGELVRGLRVIYRQHEAAFTLAHGPTARRVKVRHKWRGSSLYNPTHGLEVGWDRGDDDFDWSVGGHTHIATLIRPFYRHDRPRFAILTGTYKQADAFGQELGFPRPKGRGCGAMVLHPDGRQWPFTELDEAADFLAWLREKEGL